MKLKPFQLPSEVGKKPASMTDIADAIREVADRRSTMTETDEWGFPPAEPNKWRCEECGHTFKRQWPAPGKIAKACKCPRCKSEAAMPIGR